MGFDIYPYRWSERTDMIELCTATVYLVRLDQAASSIFTSKVLAQSVETSPRVSWCLLPTILLLWTVENRNIKNQSWDVYSLHIYVLQLLI